jgi:hypothetical protein
MLSMAQRGVMLVAAVAVMSCGKTKGSTDAQTEKQSPKAVVEAVAASAAPAKLDRSLGAGVTLAPTATVKAPQSTQGDQPEVAPKR